MYIQAFSTSWQICGCRRPNIGSAPKLARAAARYWTRIIILRGATHAVACGISVENFFFPWGGDARLRGERWVNLERWV